MAVRIRLARAGSKKKPFYRLVAANSETPRDGKFIEILGATEYFIEVLISGFE